MVEELRLTSFGGIPKSGLALFFARLRCRPTSGTWQSLQSGSAFLLLAQFALYFRRAHECSHQVGSHGVGDSAGERKVKAAFREAATGNREPARWLCCSKL